MVTFPEAPYNPGQPDFPGPVRNLGLSSMGLPKLARVKRGERISFLETQVASIIYPVVSSRVNLARFPIPVAPSGLPKAALPLTPSLNPRNLPWRTAISPTSLPCLPSLRPIFLLLPPPGNCECGSGPLAGRGRG
jgi:hypothetical protein